MMSDTEQGAPMGAAAEGWERKHTPGPWRWFNYPDGRKLLCAPARAVIHCPDAPITVESPDAALIAAAPDLLHALRCILADLPQRRGWLDPVVEVAARAAVAKATPTPPRP